jgi:predicted cupin superfamily sugar epimerase
VNELIEHYQLTPHPEGGYFRETYRGAKVPGTNRSASTAIYYLLPEGQRSTLHRIGADEVWHFYRGDPLLVVELQPGGPAKITRLGPDHRKGEQLQHVVPAGTWFGAMPAPGSPLAQPDSGTLDRRSEPRKGYSLVGCTVAPGFEFSDFELGDRDRLLSQFSECEEAVLSLTPPSAS